MDSRPETREKPENTEKQVSSIQSRKIKKHEKL